MRDDASSLHWLLSDHLGSAMKSVKASDGATSERRYRAWGEARFTNGTTPTNYRYTGQYEQPEIGLYYYGARWYDTALGRWVQPDTMTPDQYNPLDWDRYSYVRNNPIIFTDPNGHHPDNGCETEGCSSEEGEEYRDYIYNILYGAVDKKGNSKIVQEIIETIFENTASLFANQIDCFITARDCLSGDCNGWMILFALLPGTPGGLGKTVGHHTIPKQILKMLPPNIADLVRGVKGAPNIWKIPKDLHKLIHSGPGPGGYYNANWRIAIKPLLDRGNITPQEIMAIRNQLINAFGLWYWDP